MTVNSLKPVRGGQLLKEVLQPNRECENKNKLSLQKDLNL